MKTIITIIDNSTQMFTSLFYKVSMDIEPNSVEHTSPLMFALVANTFINRYPMARAPTDSIAISASPFIFLFCPVFKRKTAQITVTGRVK